MSRICSLTFIARPRAPSKGIFRSAEALRVSQPPMKQATLQMELQNCSHGRSTEPCGGCMGTLHAESSFAGDSWWRVCCQAHQQDRRVLIQSTVRVVSVARSPGERKLAGRSSVVLSLNCVCCSLLYTHCAWGSAGVVWIADPKDSEGARRMRSIGLSRELPPGWRLTVVLWVFSFNEMVSTGLQQLRPVCQKTIGSSLMAVTEGSLGLGKHDVALPSPLSRQQSFFFFRGSLL